MNPMKLGVMNPIISNLSFEDALKYIKEHTDAFAFMPVWQNETFYKLLIKI